MWKCPNCETINNSEFCIICGEPKPKYNSETHIEETKTIAERVKEEIPEKNKHKFKTIAIICISIVLVVLTAFLMLEIMRVNALNALNASDTLKAINIASKIEFYRDCDEILLEASYSEAQHLVDNGDYSAAVSFISNYLNDDYKDVKLLKQYATAMELYEEDQLVAALSDFNKISDFKDVPEIVKNLISKIYDKGMELYHNSDYTEAKKHFDALKSENYKDTDKYLILIDAHKSNLSDVSALYEFIDFEDTKEILLDDEYIGEFLVGNWVDSAGNFLKFYKKDDNTISCSYNLSWTNGKYYKIENKIHYHGSDDTGWTKQWTYQIVSKNTISVYDYINGKTYTLRR